MSDTAKTASARTDLWGLLCQLRIRQLLLIVFGLLGLVAIISTSWNALQVYRQYGDAEHLSTANEISRLALVLNAHLARERGLTTAQIASSSSATVEETKYLSDLRERSNTALRRIHQQLAEHAEFPTRDIIRDLLDGMAQRLADKRVQASQSIRKEDTARLSYSDWITAINRSIEEVADINMIAMAPRREGYDVIRYDMFLKETFFTLSENAGRERALISAVIAQRRSFVDAEYVELSNYQLIHNLMSQRLDKVLGYLPQIPSITQAQAELKTSYSERYHALRRQVIEQSQAEQAYAIDASEWFGLATTAVDAILNLSSAVDHYFNNQIDRSKAQARDTVIILFSALFVVLSLFMMAFLVTYRRIFLPLQELELSANAIARGDFSSSTKILANDEFGELAEAFELMRGSLLADRSRVKAAEGELRKLSAAIEQSVSSIIMTDVEGITEYVNPQFHITTGYDIEEVIGSKFNILRSDETALTTYEELWGVIKAGQVWQGELLNKKKNGEFYWDLVSISPVRNTQGEITHFISVQHDITERKEMENKLNFMAYHDDLTGLPNRVLLNDRFDQLVHQAQRDDKKVALMMMDLDRFKFINDSLGHRIGDQLLVQIGKRLKNISRVGDTIARYGGDEFVLLSGGISHPETLIEITKRIVTVTAEPVNIEGNSLHISTSVGISIWPDDGLDMETLLRQADTAMYHAKDMGGGRFQFFTDDLNKQTIRRLQLENALHEAIDQNQFELHYQPQLNLASGKIVGAEALIRWNHPELGLISPLDFIPLAEVTNLILPIGDWVIKTACAQAVNWKEHFNHDLLIAVNVSARQLDDDGFIERLTEIVNQSGLPYKNLEVEITESAVMQQPVKMIDILTTITSLGIKLALDDFGTGYSSLSYLRSFPFDKIKIDRSFIQDITSNKEDAAITHSICKMAHALNMTVIAEGVEIAAQVDYLRRSHCDEIQGYLISRPLPVEAFNQLLKQSSHYPVTKELS